MIEGTTVSISCAWELISVCICEWIISSVGLYTDPVMSSTHSRVSENGKLVGDKLECVYLCVCVMLIRLSWYERVLQGSSCCVWNSLQDIHKTHWTHRFHFSLHHSVFPLCVWQVQKSQKGLYKLPSSLYVAGCCCGIVDRLFLHLVP